MPGSVAIHATEIQQEGLRLPLVKLYEGGSPNATLLRIIEANTRQPDEVLGDLRAQIAACTSRRRPAALVERYGREALDAYLEALHDHAEAMMRDTIARIPDGVYTATDYIDGVGEHPVPLPITATSTVAGDEHRHRLHRHVAAGGGERSTARSRCPNRPPTAPSAASRGATSRTARAICGRSPCAPRAGGLLNPLYPAACGARGVVGYRVFDTIMQALAQVVPERAIAGGEGGPYLSRSAAGTRAGRSCSTR